MQLSILTLIMLSPILGTILVMLIPKERDEAIKTVATASVGFSLLLSLYVFLAYDRVLGGFQFIEKVSWIPSLGVGYHVAVDGFSAPQLLLTAIVGFCACLINFRLQDRARDFFAFLLPLIAGVFGSFMALDTLLMLIFYELVLFPVYVLVAGWGSKNRTYAAMKLTIYLFLGSLVAIIGLLAVYFKVGGSFDFLDMRRGIAALPAAESLEFQKQWFLPIFIGFGVLASIWPLHNWSPDGYAAAPTAVSMLHGGVLKATGAYCALRFGVQILPDGARYWMPLVAFLCLAGLIYAALIAFRQTDLKYIIGFSSVSHLGLVLLGIAAINVEGFNGAGLELFAGGVMTGLMFALVGIIYERSHERDFTKLNGLIYVFPLAGVGFVIGSLAAMGMPGFSGFPAELQIFRGLWQAAETNSTMFIGQLNRNYGWIAIGAVVSIAITAAWTLRVAGKMFFSEPTTPEWQKLEPLNGVEKFAIVLMCAVIIIVGVLPNTVMEVIAAGVRDIVAGMTTAALAAGG
jgi:NADH-quinone oxidoreductase subunit M